MLKLLIAFGFGALLYRRSRNTYNKMKIQRRTMAVDFDVTDVNGDVFKLSDFKGKPIILSFFRDALCPCCSVRADKYAQNYKEWREHGIEVVVVCSSTTEEIQALIKQHPRPFRTIADPDLLLYRQYGIKPSYKRFLNGLLAPLPQIKDGIRMSGKANVKKSYATHMSADFLISFDRRIADLWYGRGVDDHIPMKRIESFVTKVKQAQRVKKAKKQARRMKKALADTQKRVKESGVQTKFMTTK